MKSIRRSLKSDKDKDKDKDKPSSPGVPLPNSLLNSANAAPSIPAFPAPGFMAPSSAKAPPKKIVRALHNYKSRSPNELSFEKGDFFHVTGERHLAGNGGTEGDDWYEAHNPATNSRGLVPVTFFEVLGKTQKTASPPPTGSLASLNLGGSGPGGTGSSNHSNVSLNSARSGPASVAAPGAQPPKGASLYGRVQYDFDAQRADELDAKKGDHIIVIAQSNHEWFVAKPIGRLGGPGLIPVSFVEIMNMATGKPMDAAEVDDLVRGGTLPPVEEWKRSTAEYKQASIPLGRFDFGAQQQQQQAAARGTSQEARRSTSSLGKGSYAPAQTNASSSSLQRQNSQPSASRSSYLAGSSSNAHLDAHGGDDDPVGRYGLVDQASVESFHQEEGSFWFHMRCRFTSGYSLVLYRLYEDFYDFQVALMDDLPVEAGRQLPSGSSSYDKPRRILPMMPGPVDEVDEIVCAQRVTDLTVYLQELCRLSDYIRGHFRFYEFFLPRAGDVEITQPGEGAPEQAENDVVEYLDRMPGSQKAANNNNYERPTSSQSYQRGSAPSATTSRDDNYGSVDRRSNGAMNAFGASQARPPSSNGMRSPVSARTSASSTQFQAMNFGRSPPADQGSLSTTPLPGSAAASSQTGFVKVKIFHRNTDDLIAIRVPPHVTRSALLDKARERLGNEVSKLSYREEIPAGERVGGATARLVELFNDDELSDWMHGGFKLVLYTE